MQHVDTTKGLASVFELSPQNDRVGERDLASGTLRIEDPTTLVGVVGMKPAWCRPLPHEFYKIINHILFIPFVRQPIVKLVSLIVGEIMCFSCARFKDSLP